MEGLMMHAIGWSVKEGITGIAGTLSLEDVDRLSEGYSFICRAMSKLQQGLAEKWYTSPKKQAVLYSLCANAKRRALSRKPGSCHIL